MKNTKTLWITRTGVILALLIILQLVTKPFGQFITGSCVNFVLVISVIFLGMGSAAFVAILSPFLAFFLGIGPAFLPIVPGIAMGNLVLVIIVHFVSSKGRQKNDIVKNEIGVIIGAFDKFLILYILVVKLLIPFIGLPDEKASVISAMFTWPQLITALIGGTIAVLVAKPATKAINKNN